MRWIRGLAAVFAGWLLVLPGTGAADVVRCGTDSCADLVYRGLTYPYPRLPGSYLFIDGAAYPYLHITDQLLGDSTVRLPDRSEIAVSDLLRSLGLDDLIAEPLEPAIGYGSNPAPGQLLRKFSEQADGGTAVIPVMKGHLVDYDVVWTPVFVDYGSMPATITPSPGTEVDIWVTWLTPALVEPMSESEHVGESLYAVAELEDVDYTFDGPDPEKLKVYISCFGALTVDGDILAVESVPALDRRFRPANSAEAISAILPTLGWKGSVLELLYANVTAPQDRTQRSERLRALGTRADDSHALGMEACAGNRGEPEVPY